MNSPEDQRNPRYFFPKRYADAAQKLRVAFGFVLLGAFVWLSNPTVASLVAGLPIAAAGLLLRAWAAGHLAKDSELAVGGPYAYMRNPLYMGTLTAALGIVIASRNIWLAVIFAIAFTFVYLPAIELEEQHLREIFPAYDEYAAKVRRFFPVTKWTSGAAVFSWALYRKNEEYKAAIGFLFAVAWLAWRCWMRTRSQV